MPAGHPVKKDEKIELEPGVGVKGGVELDKMALPEPKAPKKVVMPPGTKFAIPGKGWVVVQTDKNTGKKKRRQMQSMRADQEPVGGSLGTPLMAESPRIPS